MHTLKPIVLASQSPRRLSLLKQLGILPEVVSPGVDEVFDSALSAEENAVRLAMHKATSVATRYPGYFTVGADTIVVLDDHMLAKPEDEEDAVRMLQSLSGRAHTVVTGLSIVDGGTDLCVSDCETTRVVFRELPEEEIRAYVAGGSPMDKAGAYGIQDDYGAVFVTRIEGCFYNVVGFPLAKFYLMLKQIENVILQRQE